MRIVFELAGDKQVNRDILRIGAHAGDARPAFSAIATLIIGETAEQFASQGAHASGGWKPLKPATLLEKERLGYGSRGILERSLDLERSLTQRGDPNMILDIQRDELVFGSRVPYAGVHQNPKPGNPLPRRRPVELTAGVRVSIVKILQRWILTGEVGE